MTSWFSRISHCSTVVTVNNDLLIRIRNHFQVNQELAEPTVSLAASNAATYSASMVESVIQDCLILLHMTAPPPIVNTDPDVDFLE